MVSVGAAVLALKQMHLDIIFKMINKTTCEKHVFKTQPDQYYSWRIKVRTRIYRQVGKARTTGTVHRCKAVARKGEVRKAGATQRR